MENFFKAVIYICFILIIFNIVISAITGLNIFVMGEESQIQGIQTDNILEQVSGYEGDMATIWLLVTTLGGGVALGAAWLMRSPTPIGVYIFGAIFWTSYKHAFNVLSVNNYIPSEFLLIITVGMLLLFLAAVIGMLTGS